MASTGPTLPPHLAKRKRTPDDDEKASADSPPTKIRASEDARTNNDEIELESQSDSDSDSDDGYGPVAPSIGPTPPPAAKTSISKSIGPSLLPTRQAEGEEEVIIGPSAPAPLKSISTEQKKRSVGPTLPPPTNANANENENEDEIPLDSDDDDDVGPAPAPAPAAAPVPRRIHGPAPPPASLAERPPDPDSNSDSDSDDDGYGPALPSTTSHQARQARALEAAAAAEEAARTAGPKRDDWMLAPPTAGPGSRGGAAADPTKMKARRFNSGPRANNAGASSSNGEISSIWTETPEEKRKRLENAVLGRDAGSSAGGRSSGNSSNDPRGPTTKIKTREEIEREDRIRQFTEATRGKSLYEEHQEAKARAKAGGGSSSSATSAGGGAKKGWVDEEEDDPSKRAFDKEKDMKLGGRIGTAQRRELLNKAADFGGRFAKGKYL